MMVLEMLEWINRLHLGHNLFTFVDKHYFKYLLFVKLTQGCNITLTDVKESFCEIEDRKVIFTIKFKKKIDVSNVSSIIEENVYNFEYNIQNKGNTMIVTIYSDTEEVYTVANLLTANA